MGRRFQEYEARGNNVPHSEIVRALKERDELNMRRAYAPLRKAEDAMVIDTSNRTIEEVVEMIIKMVPKEFPSSRNL
ncbi:(d)CMP kinase [Candidatus Collierbacteria bacterium]|nr:(d)CMP kinase [Candidatus Collierbacteria bacterium]